MNPTLKNYVMATLLAILLIIAAATATREYLSSRYGPAPQESALLFI